MFKRYDQKQTFLLPLSVEDFVALDSPARTINEVVDGLDMTCFLEKYHSRGASSYDPRMMLKVLFYAYNTGTSSSRVIAHCLETDTAYMYLSGMQRPDHRTLCRFRALHREGVEQCFGDIVGICIGLGLVGLANVSFDGTRIKANASGKRTKNKEAIDKQIKKLLDESEKTDRMEDELYGGETPYKMPEHLRDPKERQRLIREKIGELEEEKKRLEESGEKNLNFTDPDARLMRTRQGVRPSYNGQLAVDGKSQVIVAASLVKDENDNHQLLPMLDLVVRNVGRMPWFVTADSGYSSLDALEWLADKTMALIPDVMYHREKEGKTSQYPKSMFKYHEESDTYTCPGGKTLFHSGSNIYKGEKMDHYIGKECGECAQRSKCTSAENRRVARNAREYLYHDMRKRLDTHIGSQIYKERMSIVEPVYGDIKKNKGFTAFCLRGLEKASIEFNIICITHNLMKIHTHLKRPGSDTNKTTNTIRQNNFKALPN